MVNNDRVVPITSMDFLSMVGTVLTLNATAFSVLANNGEVGHFALEEGNTYLLNEPAKSITGTGKAYFVMDYDFELGDGQSMAEGSEMHADGITLYSYDGGDISALTPEVETGASGELQVR